MDGIAMTETKCALCQGTHSPEYVFHEKAGYCVPPSKAPPAPPPIPAAPQAPVDDADDRVDVVPPAPPPPPPIPGRDLDADDWALMGLAPPAPPISSAEQAAQDAADKQAKLDNASPYDLVEQDILNLNAGATISDVEKILAKFAMQQVDPKRPVAEQVVRDIIERTGTAKMTLAQVRTWYAKAYADARNSAKTEIVKSGMPILRINRDGFAASIEMNLHDTFRSGSFCRLIFDEFRHDIQVCKRDENTSLDWHKSPTPYLHDEADYTRLSEHLQRKYGFNSIEQNLLYRCIMSVAMETRINSMQQSFNIAAARYDGKKRIDTWLTDICGVEDSPLTRVYGARWLIGVAARVFEPGCQFDNVLCFEGGQGEGKTTILRTLAGRPEYYCSFTGKMNDRDSLMKVRGKLIVEFAEGVTTRKTEQDEQKEFITRTDDEYRDPYGRSMNKHKRQFGLAMTMNPSEYLNDPTGARRMWGARCGAIDLDAFHAVVGQLWGEAVRRYHGGERWHIGKGETLLIGMQKESAEERRKQHPLEPVIANWLTHTGHIINGNWRPQHKRPIPLTFIKNVGVVLRDVLGFQDTRLDRKDEGMMADILTVLGFEKAKVRGEGLGRDVNPLLGWWHQSLPQADRRAFAAQLIKSAEQE
ncbi:MULTISPECIES: virulence-associated E family protein [unclassified Mesorhizobium]|uniref:virulence-associated E family protein n=1 Tax=unclassified Mesorhizobium TaxID=325217 RepID=UPI0013DEADD1|nr:MULTISPECIES: virulence-associated E family protein [unclassified Mesorhizobium]